MKNKKITRLLFFIAMITIITGYLQPVFAHDYFIESLEDIIKKSTDILEVNFTQKSGHFEKTTCINLLYP